MFCHVSDYGARGYQNLHRLIATSRPLVLWAPSAFVLKEQYDRGKARIDPRTLASFVESGYVQIIGRENWLTDEHFRRNHRWSGAVWTDFDARVKSICVEDQSLPEAARRVSVVEPEDGYVWADQLIADEPQRIEEVWKLLQSRRVPVGTRERVARLGDPAKVTAVREVLRDTRNHSRAFELADSDIMAMSNGYSKFFRLLESRGSLRRPSSSGPPKERIVDATVKLLGRLESMGPTSSLEKFVGSREHEELTEWMAIVFREAKSVKRTELEEFLRTRLGEEVEGGQVQETWLRFFGLPEARVGGSLTATGLVLAIVGFVLDPTHLLGIAGVGVGAFPMVSGICRRLGLVKPEYKGPEWPFMYAFGNRPSAQDIAKVLSFFSDQ